MRPNEMKFRRRSELDAIWLLEDNIASLKACVAYRPGQDGAPVLTLGLTFRALMGDDQSAAFGPFKSVDDARDSVRGAMIKRLGRGPKGAWSNEDARVPSWSAKASLYKFPRTLNLEISVVLVETFMRAADQGQPVHEAISQAWASNKGEDEPAPPPKPSGDGHGSMDLGPGNGVSVVQVTEKRLPAVSPSDSVYVLTAKWIGKPRGLEGVKKKVAEARSSER